MRTSQWLVPDRPLRDWQNHSTIEKCDDGFNDCAVESYQYLLCNSKPRELSQEVSAVAPFCDLRSCEIVVNV